MPAHEFTPACSLLFQEQNRIPGSMLKERNMKKLLNAALTIMIGLALIASVYLYSCAGMGSNPAFPKYETGLSLFR
jgi:hypothetical protein